MQGKGMITRSRTLHHSRTKTKFAWTWPELDIAQKSICPMPTQIRVEPDDVWKTAFTTMLGTFILHVMQQGNCNAPATFQRLMTWIFREHIGIFIRVYLDDIFVRIALLRKHCLFLSRPKLDLYSEDMDCLGHRIDDLGLHADSDKMSRIVEWRTPRSYPEVLRFLGLVKYLAHFMPDVSAYTSPMELICSNGQPFYSTHVWDASKILLARHRYSEP